MNKLLLASQSPRRKQLLQQIGINPICLPVDIDESLKANEQPLEYCQRLAKEKAQTCWHQNDGDNAVLGADTIVVLNNETLGKPKDKSDAINMLLKLSNQTHQVITAIAIIKNGELKNNHSISEVTFTNIKKAEIIDYVESGEPMDKAGSYAVQGFAAKWIKIISGSYSGIMGLPLYETSELLNEL